MALDDLFGETSCQPVADQTQSKNKVSQAAFHSYNPGNSDTIGSEVMFLDHFPVFSSLQDRQ